MSKRSDEAKVVFILEMIGRIDMIVERHGGIIEALEVQVCFVPPYGTKRG